MLEEGCEQARQLFNFFVRCYPPGSVLPSSTVLGNPIAGKNMIA
jgi:hypothetical protein